MAFDPYAPYGPVVESAVRVVTWNVWGRYGPRWETRQAALEDTLAEVEPDLVCLVEAWHSGDSSQPELVARRLGLPYQHFVGDWEQEDWVSGVGLVCRWPMSEPRRHPLRSADGAGFGEVVHVAVDGERGTIQLFAVVLGYPLDGSGIRQAQVKQLASLIDDVAPKRDLVVVCGDFNAGPDSDEIRMLTGRAATAVPTSCSTTAGKWQATVLRAIPGPTGIRSRPCGPPKGAARGARRCQEDEERRVRRSARHARTIRPPGAACR